jgi:hypothetical protein
MTFLNGEVILDKPGGLGTFRWRCVEKDGWLGFQDPVSAMYLGHNERWLPCAVKKHSTWEHICPRKRPKGGYILLVMFGNRLVPLGARPDMNEKGTEQKVPLVKNTDWKDDGMAWDFIEVTE